MYVVSFIFFFFVCVFFFCQAEDGIRDLVRSRGLGDVYKRQIVTRVTNDVEALNELFSSGIVTVFSDVFTIIWIFGFMFFMSWELALITPVSYTHLTLPTSDLV